MIIPGLMVIKKPLETYLIVRESDGDRELTPVECEKLFAAATEVGPLHEALAKLANEVDASISLMEPLCRREFGNTNYQCIMDRVAEARRLLRRTGL
jgi:hypothetical protein